MKKSGNAYSMPKVSKRMPKPKRTDMSKRVSLMTKRLKNNPFKKA